MGGSQVEPKNQGKSYVGGKIRQRSSRKFPVFGEAAQELVEFAIVLPLLFLVLFGVIDLGRLFHASITITNAARVGARHLAQYPDEIATAKGLAEQEANQSGIPVDIGDITIRCYVGGTYQVVESGDKCDRMVPHEVSVGFDFQLMLGPILPGGFIVPGSACPDGRNLCFTLVRTMEMLVQ